MKKYLPYITVFIIGTIIGVLCNYCISHNRETEVQRDTMIVYEKMPYSKLELDAKTIKLDVPDIGRTRLVYIPESTTTIIYQDSIRYVTLPRQYFFTSTDDVEIWHSGIDSTIDSLNVFRKTTNITNTVSKKVKRNEVSIGMEANYSGVFRMPIQAQYSHRVVPWLSVYGYAEYEPFVGQIGVGIGTQMTIEF